jgi:hypothetical protein
MSIAVAVRELERVLRVVRVVELPELVLELYALVELVVVLAGELVSAVRVPVPHSGQAGRTARPACGQERKDLQEQRPRRPSLHQRTEQNL